MSEDIKENKFHKGNKEGKHYWLTPPELMKELNSEFEFDFDPCPYPKPDDFDGLTCEWGTSNYVNPPFGSIMHMDPRKDKKPKKKGPTAWARKSIQEYEKGKKVVMVYPIDKWVLMLLEKCSEVRNLGDVKWLSIEDGGEGAGIGRHVACFVLNPDRKSDRQKLQTAQKEIKNLEKQLERERACVDFYADKDNWAVDDSDDYEPKGHRRKIKNDCDDCFDNWGAKILRGGKRARETQAIRGGGE